MKATFFIRASIILAASSGFWHAGHVESCYSGRYGRYENWPSIADWEELFFLFTGKTIGGGNGWGWTGTNSYGYNSLSGGSDYGYSGGFTGSPWKTALDDVGYGSFGSSIASSTGHHGGGSSGSGNSGSSGFSSNKLKEALNNYFKNKPTTSTYTKPKQKSKRPPTISSYRPLKTTFGYGSDGHGGGGVGVGEVFPDTPGPGPAYPHHRPDHDDVPLRSYGPPYDTVSNWAHDDSHGGTQSPYVNKWESPNSHGGPPSHFASGPENDHFSHDHDHPPSSYSPDVHDHHGPPDDHHGPPPEDHHSDNQFKVDYDIFKGNDRHPDGPGFFNKKRRQGRRRRVGHRQPSTNVPVRAGLPNSMKPKMPRPLSKYPLPISSIAQRKQRRMMRRRGRGPARGGPPPRRSRFSRREDVRNMLLNTKFGGYKVDHSRLRLGKK